MKILIKSMLETTWPFVALIMRAFLVSLVYNAETIEVSLLIKICFYFYIWYPFLRWLYYEWCTKILDTKRQFRKKIVK